MNTAGQVIAWFFALLLLGLAYRFTHKEKYVLATLSIVSAVVLCLSGQPWFQGFFKLDLISRVLTTMEGYGKKLNEFQETTAKMKIELSDHQSQIDKHQKELSNQQEKTKAAQVQVSDQQTNITEHYRQLGTIYRQLGAVQTNILTQQERLADVEYLVNNLYAKMVFERFAMNDSKRAVVRLSTNGSIVVAVRLKHVPITNSIQASIEQGRRIKPVFVLGNCCLVPQ